MGADLTLVSSQPQVFQLGHHQMITNKPGSNGRVQVVRCWCCSGLTGPPRRFFAFPALGEVSSPEELQELWAAHLAGKRPRHLHAV